MGGAEWRKIDPTKNGNLGITAAKTHAGPAEDKASGSFADGRQFAATLMAPPFLSILCTEGVGQRLKLWRKARSGMLIER
ncbi:MAG: hypothetical protein LW742_05335 [Sphingomonadales bacterium]|jgi:hypothetical protein|nr:hypothetical protein [Sphingomonadales bacterium]